MKLIEVNDLGFSQYSLVIDGVHVSIFVDAGIGGCEGAGRSAASWRPARRTFSGVYHKAHIPDGQDHIHVHQRNNQLFALNVDGTAHDNSHGTRIPNRIADGLRRHFPDVTLPPNNFIESVDNNVQTRFETLLHG